MKSDKKKVFVLLVSQKFMKGFAFDEMIGKPTDFESKILSGQKIHTLRSNYKYWFRIVNQVNNGLAVLSLRKWSGIPYKSPQVEICQFTSLGIEHVDIDLSHPNPYLITDMMRVAMPFLEEISINDGLEMVEFERWFAKPFEGCVIHFTDFRYIS